MKKSVILGALGGLFIAGMASATLVDYFNDSYYYLYAPTELTGGGTVIPSSLNWVYAVYDASLASIGGTPTDATLGVLFSGNVWNDDGYLYNGGNDYDGANAVTVFTRIYNVSDLGSVDGSTYYVTLFDGDDGLHTIPAGDNATEDLYDIGGSFDEFGSDLGQWQPVPVPTSMALFGLGVLTLAAGRRLKKKSK